MSSNKIATYGMEDMWQRFVMSGDTLDDMLRSGFGKFFISRVEQLAQRMKSLSATVKSTSHSLVYLTSGFVEMTIGGAGYRLGAGECLIIQAGQVFSIGEVDVDGGQGFIVVVHNDFIQGYTAPRNLFTDFEFLTAWGNPYICFEESQASNIVALFTRMYEEYEVLGLDHVRLMQACFYALLCELSFAYHPVRPQAPLASVSIANRFRTLLMEHIRTVNKVSDYAAMLNLSPNHLNKAVKQATGRTAASWTDEALVLEAKALLHQTDMPVSEIATSIGVADRSYFSRMFRRHTGDTPQAFRRKIEES